MGQFYIAVLEAFLAMFQGTAYIKDEPFSPENDG